MLLLKIKSRCCVHDFDEGLSVLDFVFLLDSSGKVGVFSGSEELNQQQALIRGGEEVRGVERKRRKLGRASVQNGECVRL